VRDNKTHHHPTWHYVNYPIVRPGEEKDVHVPAQPTGDLLTTLKANIQSLSSDKPDAEKAVALCWELHQVGEPAARPHYAWAHYNLADTLDEPKIHSEAADHWRAYLKYDQTSEHAEHARYRLSVCS
jgi:hypothetical protein